MSTRDLLQHDFHIEILRSETIDAAVRLQILQRLIERILQRLVALAHAKTHTGTKQLLVANRRSRELIARTLRTLQETLRCRFGILERRVETTRSEIFINLVLRLV